MACLTAPGDASFEGRRVGMDLGTGPGCIKIKQTGMLEQCFLLHGTSVPLLDQQLFDPLDHLACRIVYLEDDLPDFRPIVFFDAIDDVQLGLLGIDLEQVDLVDLVLAMMSDKDVNWHS